MRRQSHIPRSAAPEQPHCTSYPEKAAKGISSWRKMGPFRCLICIQIQVIRFQRQGKVNRTPSAGQLEKLCNLRLRPQEWHQDGATGRGRQPRGLEDETQLPACFSLLAGDAMPEEFLVEGPGVASTVCHMPGGGTEPEGAPGSVLKLPALWRMHGSLDITQALLAALGHRKGSPVLSSTAISRIFPCLPNITFYYLL